MLSILIVQLDHIDHGELSPLPALPCGNTLGYQFNGASWDGDADKKLDSERKEFIRDVHKRAGSVCFGRV